MIQSNELTKRFGDFAALDRVNCHIPDGCIYGMVGSNGAGKSTFLRVLTGIYKADSGTILVDDRPVYENPVVKSEMMFVPDELYFLPGASMNRMAKMYASIYPRFDQERYQKLVSAFGLSPTKNIHTFSKGMKRQAAIILALAARPKYMMFDETFDGLDPMMRKLVKSFICNDVAELGATAIITSHSLRELEDTCDQLVLLHRGGVVLQSEVNNLKSGVSKVQAAFSQEYTIKLFDDLDLVSFNKSGSVANIIVRGNREEIQEKMLAKNPLLFEILPLTLEEVFMFEMSSLGYEFNEVLEELSHE